MFTKPLTRAPRYILIKSFFLAIGWRYLHDLSHAFLKRLTLTRWNCMSKALRFLQITAKHQDCPIFSVFLTIKTSSQNISITLLQIPLKLHEQWGGYWRKSSRERFFEEQFPVPRNTAASKIGNGVISLLWLIATLIITIFHLYLIQPLDSMFSSSISKQRRKGKTSTRTRLINREECTFQEFR